MRACPTIHAAALAGLLAASSVAGPAQAVPGGDLAVLPKGHYVCEIPGDPSDPALFAGTRQRDAEFDVIGDSSYRAQGVRGVYFMTGDQLRFTTGALEGKRLHRVGPTFLRAIAADGSDGDLRCVNSIQATPPEPSAQSRCKRQRAGNVLARRQDAAPTC